MTQVLQKHGSYKAGWAKQSEFALARAAAGCTSARLGQRCCVRVCHLSSGLTPASCTISGIQFHGYHSNLGLHACTAHLAAVAAGPTFARELHQAAAAAATGGNSATSAATAVGTAASAAGVL